MTIQGIEPRFGGNAALSMVTILTPSITVDMYFIFIPPKAQ